MLKYHSLLTILVFTFCFLGFLAESSSDTPNQSSQISNNTCQDRLNYTRAEFFIDICLMKQGAQDAAMISLQNNNTSDVYELKVSQSYIDQNAQMSLLYQDPQAFFSLLKQEESTINTNSNAQILIQNKFFRVLRLIPRKQILDKTDNIINKLIIIQSTQKEMLENKEKLNFSLVQTKKQLQAHDQRINQMLQQLEPVIMSLSTKIAQLLFQINLVRNENSIQIAQMKRETLSFNQTIETEKQGNELQSTQIKLMQTALFYELIPINRIYNHNNQYFATQTYNTNLKLRYKASGWIGFFKSLYIQVGKITRLQVNQTKTKARLIMYGVSTERNIGRGSPHWQSELKLYGAQRGYIYQNNNYYNGGARIYDGTVITIVADLINWKVSWEANGNKLAERAIPADMMAKKLYFIINIRDNNDQLEILDY